MALHFSGRSPALRHLHLGLAVFCALLLAWKFTLLPRININWDEFFFLSSVYEFQRGALANGFQTFYVRLFGWVPALADGEIDQVIAGRHLMFLVRVGTCALLLALGQMLTGRTGAWAAVFLALSFPYLIRHGEALRADPMICLLFLGSAALLVWRPSHALSVTAAAALAALAFMISVKAVFYFPTLGALLLIPWLAGKDSRGTLTRVLIFGAIAAALAAWLTWLHIAGIRPGAADVALRTASSVGRRMLEPPPMDVLWSTLQRDWMFWLLVVTGGGLAIRMAITGPPAERGRALALLALLLPLATLPFYRNSYPYFYVAIVPGACLAAGLVVAWIARRFAGHPSRIVAMLALLLAPAAVNAVTTLRALSADTVRDQRFIVDAIHGLFPEPVPYIDRCGMIASFPKAGPLMSTLYLARYRSVGKPIMPGLLRSRQPVFLLNNVAGLQLGGPWDPNEPNRLLQEDFEYLQANFVQHWGPLWVAGKTVEARMNQPTPFEMPVAGPYTVQADGEVILDGKPVRGGEALFLRQGPHTLRASAQEQTVTLRYGKLLPRPPPPPDRRPLVMFLGL